MRSCEFLCRNLLTVGSEFENQFDVALDIDVLHNIHNNNRQTYFDAIGRCPNVGGVVQINMRSLLDVWSSCRKKWGIVGVRSRNTCPVAPDSSARSAGGTRRVSSCVLRPLSVLVALCVCVTVTVAAVEGSPWPVETHSNGSVVLRAHENSIIILPKEGHAVVIEGDLLVQGINVVEQLQALVPPPCDGANDKLVYNGTAWECACESSWSGEACDVNLQTCAIMASLFSLELSINGLNNNILADDVVLIDPPTVLATGGEWSTSAFMVTSVQSSNESAMTAEWLADVNKIRLNRSDSLTAADGLLPSTLTFSGSVEELGDDVPCELSTVVDTAADAHWDTDALEGLCDGTHSTSAIASLNYGNFDWFCPTGSVEPSVSWTTTTGSLATFNLDELNGEWGAKAGYEIDIAYNVNPSSSSYATLYVCNEDTDECEQIPFVNNQDMTFHISPSDFPSWHGAPLSFRVLDSNDSINGTGISLIKLKVTVRVPAETVLALG